MAVLDRNSKADTRFLCDRDGGGAPELATDISQWRANLTNNTTYLTSTDARLAVRSPREISVVIWIATGDSRVILNWGQGTSYIYRIDVASGGTGTVRFGHNGGTIASIIPPNVGGTARQYIIHWSTEYDVREGDYFSELAICDIASGNWSITRVTHNQPQAPAGGDQFNLRGVGAGLTPFTGGLAAYDFVRVGCRFHSTTEAKEDWYSESSAPTLAGVQPDVELAPTAPTFFSADPADDVADAMLDAATLAGAAEFAAVVNAAAGRKRLYSPLVNVAWRSPPTLDDTYAPTKFLRDLNSGLYKVDVARVFARPLPYQAFACRVRVHVQAWIAAGAPGGTTVSITLAAHQLVTLAAANATSVQLVITDDHTSTGIGQWYELPAMLLSGVPLCYLAIGHKFGAGTGHAYLRMKIKAVQIEPYEAT